MPTPILETSAPGKLFLFGEYGVLTAGWSLVAAVDRRVSAFRAAPQTAEPTGYQALGADLDDATALPRAVLDVLGERASSATLDRLGTDVRRLFARSDHEGNQEQTQKLGLGSSAASTVALIAVCMEASCSAEPGEAIDEARRHEIFEHAFAAHRNLQGGRGSGADIAASALGGFVAYRLDEPTPGFPRCGREELGAPTTRLSAAEVLACPAPSVRIEPVWLGEPAVSTSFVRRCEEALAREPSTVTDALCETSHIARQAIEALFADETQLLLSLVDRADQALERLGELIEAPIVTDAHRALRRLAEEAGLSVKPSGAGGGDFSLVFGPPQAPWTKFLEALSAQSLRHLPMQLGAEGVRVETAASPHT